jgi:hypothetical protein
MAEDDKPMSGRANDSMTLRHIEQAADLQRSLSTAHLQEAAANLGSSGGQTGSTNTSPQTTVPTGQQQGTPDKK